MNPEIKLEKLSDRELLILAVQGLNESGTTLNQHGTRIRKLEDWRNVLAGGLCVVTFLVPITMWVAGRI